MIGKNVKAIRKLLGLNQMQVAGEDFNRAYISMIESGKARIVNETLIKLMKNMEEFNDTGVRIELEDFYSKDRFLNKTEIAKDLKKVKHLIDIGEYFDPQSYTLKYLDINVPTYKAELYSILAQYALDARLSDAVQFEIAHLTLEQYLLMQNGEQVLLYIERILRALRRAGMYRRANYYYQISKKYFEYFGSVKEKFVFLNTVLRLMSKLGDDHEVSFITSLQSELVEAVNVHEAANFYITAGMYYYDRDDVEKTEKFFSSLLHEKFAGPYQDLAKAALLITTYYNEGVKNSLYRELYQNVVDELYTFSYLGHLTKCLKIYALSHGYARDFDYITLRSIEHYSQNHDEQSIILAVQMYVEARHEKDPAIHKKILGQIMNYFEDHDYAPLLSLLMN